MSTTKKVVIGIIIGVVAVVLVGILLASQSASNLGGTVVNYPTAFVNGLKAGNSNQLVISSTGAITSGAITSSGNLTTTGKAAVGTATVGSNEFTVYAASGTSTVALTGSKGCIQMITTNGSTSKMMVSGTSTIAWVLAAGTCE